MDAEKLFKTSTDQNRELTFGEALQRYQEGNLDKQAQKRLDEFKERTAEAVGRITRMAAITQEELLFRLTSQLARTHVFEQYLEGLNRTFLVSHDELNLKLSQALIDASAVLAGNGWFLCVELPYHTIWELREAFESGAADEADIALSEYFEERLDKILLTLSTRFPERAKILKSSFEAHKTGEFNLSIPVFLAQSDGIAKSIYGEYFFVSVKGKGKPKTANVVENLQIDILTQSVLSLHTFKSPINQSESERPVNFVGLNRHTVMHGESLDYGTKLNSLKAISLLNYLSTAYFPEAK